MKMRFILLTLFLLIVFQNVKSYQSHSSTKALLHNITEPTYGPNCGLFEDEEEKGKFYPNCTLGCFADNQIMTENKRCEIADISCQKQDQFDRYNFFALCYCALGGNLYLFLPTTLFIIYIIFSFTSATVEEYIAAGITYINEAMGLSEAMGAVTLLALANGAGDVITAIVASDSEGGVSYNIGALYGAGFFVCSMVICLTIRNSSTDIVVDKSTIFRDVGLYVIATVVTIIFAWTNYIYWWSACIFLLLYVALVVIVYIQDLAEKKNGEGADQEQNILPASNSKNTSPEKSQNGKDDKKAYGKQISSLNKFKKIGQFVLKHAKVVSIISRACKKKMLEEKEESFKEMSCLGKILFIIDFPLNILRKITIPPCEKEQYNKWYCIMWPIPGTLFVLYAFQLHENLQYVMYGTIAGAVLTLIFYLTQRNLKEGQVPKYFFLIAVIGTISGLIWTYIACSMLIDILDVYVIIFNLNKTFMGLTILGIGNALPDSLTTIALAKKGYAQMGITGSYAGQLFGLLVGFGLAQLKQTLKNGKQLFDLISNPTENLLDLLVIMFCLVNLIVTMVIGIKNKYKFEKSLSIIVGGLYILFFICAVGVQVYYMTSEKVIH